MSDSTAVAPAAEVTLTRLDDQIAWYSQKSSLNQRRYKSLKVLTIAPAAVIPVVTTSGVHYGSPIAAGLGVLIAVAEGVQQLNQYNPNWTSYRATAEALKHEKFLYLAKAGPIAPPKMRPPRWPNAWRRWSPRRGPNGSPFSQLRSKTDLEELPDKPAADHQFAGWNLIIGFELAAHRLAKICEVELPEVNALMLMLDRKSRSSSANSSDSPAASKRLKARSVSSGEAGPRFDFARIAVMAPASNDAVQIHQTARFGASGAARQLPHLGTIQRSFGRHSVTAIQSHSDERAKEISLAMGANAFAMGDHVAFAGAPSLRIAAHEAAHVVQQRAGVHLPGGVGKAGDRHEEHANAVAGRVVNGESSETLLDAYAGEAAPGQAVQRDENRPPTSRNEEYSGDKTGPLALPGAKFVSDPYAHSVLVVRPDGTGVQYVYETVREDGQDREKLIRPGKELEPIRVKALIEIAKTGAEKAQETAAESKTRQDDDVAKLAKWKAQSIRRIGPPTRPLSTR